MAKRTYQVVRETSGWGVIELPKGDIVYDMIKSHTEAQTIAAVLGAAKGRRDWGAIEKEVRRRLESHLATSAKYPDTVSVLMFPGDEFEMGNLYSVIQRGIWWWKYWAIAYYVADCAAVGNCGGWWNEVSIFGTKEGALAALYAGKFPQEI